MSEAALATSPSVEQIRAAVDDLLSQRGDEIWRVVQERLRGLTGFDRGQVRPDSGLVDELGLDSLDFVELEVALGRSFGVRIRIDRIQPAIQSGVSLDLDQKLPPVTLERLRIVMPEMAERIHEGCRSQDILSLLTTEALVRLVAWSLADVEGQQTRP